MTSVNCTACGAALRAEAGWCTQCFAVPSVVVPPVAPGRQQSQVDEPAAQPVHSRWRKSTTTFGPVGRVGWTVAMVLVAGLCVFSGNPFAVGVWLFVAMPLVLRSVWAKGRLS